MQWDKKKIDSFKASLSITLVAKALGLSVENGRCHCFYPMRHAHGDRTPSLSISEAKGLFRCWVCPDVRGDVIDLVQLVRDCSFPEALKWLVEEFRPWENSEPLQTNAMHPKQEIVFPEERPLVLEEEISPTLHDKVILSFLKKLVPVENTQAASWLVRRRIFKSIWNKMKLRYVEDYDGISKSLQEEFGVELLQKVGLFNKRGHLRYYKHRLIFPYLDSQGKASYFQARSILANTFPKEQNLPGRVPFPYNSKILDGSPDWVYLCEGVVDTLTLLCRNISAVGIPGVSSFKTEWVPLFKGKNVIISFDKDEAGRNGALVVQELLSVAGIHNVIGGNLKLPEMFRMKEGNDINDFFGGRK